MNLSNTMLTWWKVHKNIAIHVAELLNGNKRVYDPKTDESNMYFIRLC